MSNIPPLLTLLALIIDLKEQRLEKTRGPFLRRQLRAQLDELLERFQREYDEFLIASGQAPLVEPWRKAA
jgi:hypothetical protein